jgi:uncharacterized protein (TIGR00266 family)
MEHETQHRPTFSLLTLTLEADEKVVSEAGALVSHEEGITIETGTRGGIWGSLKRTIGGESFFVNTFTAEREAEVSFAPPLPGDVVRHDLDATTDERIVQSGSFLAAGPDVTVDTRWGSARTFFGGEGLFMLRLAGEGPTFLSSYGAIERVEVPAGETFTVDSGHIAAFEATMGYDLKMVGGLKSTMFSGEGLVTTFDGPGTVWLQSRNQDAFISWLVPKLPVTRSSGGGGSGVRFGGSGLNFDFGGGGGRDR